MVYEVGPCVTARFDLQLVSMVSTALTAILTMWLAHRRALADSERKEFYRQMRDKHGLDHPVAREGGPARKRPKR